MKKNKSPTLLGHLAVALSYLLTAQASSQQRCGSATAELAGIACCLSPEQPQVRQTPEPFTVICKYLLIHCTTVF